jgi:hypothetical protein
MVVLTDGQDRSVVELIDKKLMLQVLDMPVDPNEPTYCLCQQVPPYIENVSAFQEE